MSSIVFGSDRIVGLTSVESFVFQIIERPEGNETVDVLTHLDVNYKKTTSTNAIPNYDIFVSGPETSEYTFESLDESVSTVAPSPTIDNIGIVTYVGNGLSRIIITDTDTGLRKLSEVQLAAGQTTVILSFDSFVPGTLGAAATGIMNSLVNGKLPGDSTQQYIISNNASVTDPQVVKNTGLFSETLDWSGFTVIRQDQIDDRYPPALVTNRHAIVAWHTVFGLVGKKIVFKNPDNSYQIVTVLAADEVINNDPSLPGINSPDIGVLYLSEAITNARIYKTLAPQDFDTYIPSIKIRSQNEIDPEATGTYWSTALLVFRKAMHDLNKAFKSYMQIGTASEISNLTIGEYIPTTETQPETTGWGILGIQGDSGSPSFIVAEVGDPILITTKYRDTVGTDISFYTDQINTIMNTQAGTVDVYALTHPDLSAFTSFPIAQQLPI